MNLRGAADGGGRVNAVAEQRAAAFIARLHDGLERPEDMPTSCYKCGNCCGRNLPADLEDVRRIERYANRHHLEPTMGNLGGRSGRDQMCAWLDTDTKMCRIYPARPKVCRCWGSPHDGALIGTKPGQPCGLRVDMLDVWKRLGTIGMYDTWTSEWRVEE